MSSFPFTGHFSELLVNEKKKVNDSVQFEKVLCTRGACNRCTCKKSGVRGLRVCVCEGHAPIRRRPKTPEFLTIHFVGTHSHHRKNEQKNDRVTHARVSTASSQKKTVFAP